MQAKVAYRPKVSFESDNIWSRLEACKIVAQAHGWHPNDIIHFSEEVLVAFTYEEAMAVIEREFEVAGPRD